MANSSGLPYGATDDRLLEVVDRQSAGPLVFRIDNRNSVVATRSPTMIALGQLARFDSHGRLMLLDANENEICVEQDAGIVCDAPFGMPFAFNGRWRSPATGLVNMRPAGTRRGSVSSRHPIRWAMSICTTFEASRRSTR